MLRNGAAGFLDFDRFFLSGYVVIFFWFALKKERLKGLNERGCKKRGWFFSGLVVKAYRISCHVGLLSNPLFNLSFFSQNLFSHEEYEYNFFISYCECLSHSSLIQYHVRILYSIQFYFALCNRIFWNYSRANKYDLCQFPLTLYEDISNKPTVVLRLEVRQPSIATIMYGRLLLETPADPR